MLTPALQDDDETTCLRQLRCGAIQEAGVCLYNQALSCIGNVVCWEVNLGKHFRIQCSLCSPPLSFCLSIPLRSLPLAAHQRAVDCRMLVLHCIQILTSSRVFFPELLLTFTLAIDLRATCLLREKGRGCTHHGRRQDSHCAPPLLY